MDIKSFEFNFNKFYDYIKKFNEGDIEISIDFGIIPKFNVGEKTVVMLCDGDYAYNKDLDISVGSAFTFKRDEPRAFFLNSRYPSEDMALGGCKIDFGFNAVMVSETFKDTYIFKCSLSAEKVYKNKNDYFALKKPTYSKFDYDKLHNIRGDLYRLLFAEVCRFIDYIQL